MIKDLISAYKQQHGYAKFAPRCVLFDMDGVLYNSMPNHAVAWQEAMKQFDIHFTAADSYATEGARGVDTIRKYVLQQKGKEITPEEAQRMYDVKTDIFHHMPVAKIFPGVIEQRTAPAYKAFAYRLRRIPNRRPYCYSLRRGAWQTQPRPLSYGIAQNG